MIKTNKPLTETDFAAMTPKQFQKFMKNFDIDLYTNDKLNQVMKVLENLAVKMPSLFSEKEKQPKNSLFKLFAKLSLENKNLLSDKKDCICYNCGKRFHVSEITDWFSDKNQETAVCPYCELDYVIPYDPNWEKIILEDLKKS